MWIPLFLGLASPIRALVYDSAQLGGALFGNSATSKVDPNTMSFLALGDWGGASLECSAPEDTKPYPGSFKPGNCTTRGQENTAAGMGTVASTLSAQFVLGLGDNFYESGLTYITAPGRFQRTFESVYKARSLHVPWYLVAGNHDHLGSIDHQLEYSRKSSRWRFPSMNYSFTVEIPGGRTAKFIMYDSVILGGMTSSDKHSAIFTAPGPSSVSSASGQLGWIGEELHSNADYLFLVGHYPIYSACDHGPTFFLVSQLLPLLKDARATAHISGHDHCLNHIESEGIAHIISGAGAIGSHDVGFYGLSNAGRIPKGSLKFHLSSENAGQNTGGFVSITLGEQGRVQYHADNGSELFTTTLQPRK